MKNIIITAALGVVFMATGASAAEVSCPTGQHAEATTTAAYDETITLPASTTPAYTTCDHVGWPSGNYKDSACTQHGHSWQEVYKKVSHPAVEHPAITYTVHHEAVDETICVNDVVATSTPEVTLEPKKPVSGGNGQIWCSSPTAPGWRVDQPNGGCDRSQPLLTGKEHQLYLALREVHPLLVKLVAMLSAQTRILASK